MNYKINHWNIGDRVKITRETFKYMEGSNRSFLAYPSDDYLKTAKSCIGVTGVVERKFPPGYEVNVRFDNDIILQVKDHWIERA